MRDSDEPCLEDWIDKSVKIAMVADGKEIVIGDDGQKILRVGQKWVEVESASGKRYQIHLPLCSLNDPRMPVTLVNG